MTARKLSSNIDANGKKVTGLGAPTAASNDATRQVDLEAGVASAKSRTNHTGTQLANTVSDFDTQVRTSRLDQMAAPTNPVAINAQRITGVADPTAAQDGATKNYVDNQVAGLVSGQTLKGAVIAAIGVNVTIASPGAAVDGVTFQTGGIYLLTAQTTGSQNGPYVFNGSATPMTRATNWNSSTNAVLGSYWVVETSSTSLAWADSFALMTNDAFTFGTTTPAFISRGITQTFPPVEVDLGDGSAVAFTVTHNFGTKAVNVVVIRNAAPYDEVDVYITHPTVNTVTVEPDEVWSSGQYHAIVSKS